MEQGRVEAQALWLWTLFAGCERGIARFVLRFFITLTKLERLERFEKKNDKIQVISQLKCIKLTVSNPVLKRVHK